MGLPVECVNPYKGVECPICSGSLFESKGTPAYVYVTWENIIHCGIGPAPLLGTFKLPQVTGIPCMFRSVTYDNGFVTIMGWYQRPPPFNNCGCWQVQEDALGIWWIFFDIKVFCSVNFVNDHVIGNCKFPNGGDGISGHGGTAEITPYSAEFLAHWMLCNNHFYPLGLSKYNYSIKGNGNYILKLAHKQKQMNILAEIDPAFIP